MDTIPLPGWITAKGFSGKPRRINLNFVTDIFHNSCQVSVKGGPTAYEWRPCITFQKNVPAKYGQQETDIPIEGNEALIAALGLNHPSDE